MMRTPRNRVQDMLKQIRQQQNTSQALVEHMPSYSQAYASTNLNIQRGGGNHTRSENMSEHANIAIFVCIIIILTILFVYIGEYVDNCLVEYEQHQDTDQSTRISVLVFQLIFNVTMLVVPYIILHIYAKDSLAHQYYLVIAAFWVLSLQAQPQLKYRFKQLLREEEEPVRNQVDNDEDTQLINEHFAEAEHQQKQETENIQYRHNQVARMTEQQQVYNHDIPLQFNSQDLMPMRTMDNLNRETNLADLF